MDFSQSGKKSNGFMLKNHGSIIPKVHAEKVSLIGLRSNKESKEGLLPVSFSKKVLQFTYSNVDVKN